MRRQTIREEFADIQFQRQPIPNQIQDGWVFLLILNEFHCGPVNVSKRSQALFRNATIFPFLSESFAQEGIDFGGCVLGHASTMIDKSQVGDEDKSPP